MTLVVALACKDGVVIASDGQTTISSEGTRGTGIPIKLVMPKIKQFGGNKLWAAAGNVGNSQKFEEKLNEISKGLIECPLDNEKLRQKIKELALNVRAQDIARWRTIYGLGTDHAVEGNEYIFVEHQGHPVIWYINKDISDVFWEKYGYYAIGNGKIFADTLLRNFSLNECTIEQGCLIAYMVIQETINIATYGISEPIDVWTIKNIEIKQKSEEERDRLKNSYHEWIKAQQDLFKGIIL